MAVCKNCRCARNKTPCVSCYPSRNKKCNNASALDSLNHVSDPPTSASYPAAIPQSQQADNLADNNQTNGPNINCGNFSSPISKDILLLSGASVLDRTPKGARNLAAAVLSRL